MGGYPGASKSPGKAPKKPTPAFKQEIKKTARKNGKVLPGLKEDASMEDLDTIENIFRMVDQDGEGTLDIDELKKLFLEIAPVLVNRPIDEDDAARWALECINQASGGGDRVDMDGFRYRLCAVAPSVLLLLPRTRSLTRIHISHTQVC